MFSHIPSHRTEDSSAAEPDQQQDSPAKKQADDSHGSATVCLTIFIFRGEPDAHYNRHTLIYFTSPQNPNLHSTVHIQRDEDTSPWRVDRMHKPVDWTLEVNYIAHVNAGAVQVQTGEEMVPVDIAAGVSVAGWEDEAEWNCQHFVFAVLTEFVLRGYQTPEWYEHVEGELMDRLIEGTSI